MSRKIVVFGWVLKIALAMLAIVITIMILYPAVDPDEISEIQAIQIQADEDIQKNTDAIKRVKKVIGKRAE